MFASFLAVEQMVSFCVLPREKGILLHWVGLPSTHQTSRRQRGHFSLYSGLSFLSTTNLSKLLSIGGESSRSFRCPSYHYLWLNNKKETTNFVELWMSSSFYYHRDFNKALQFPSSCLFFTHTLHFWKEGSAVFSQFKLSVRREAKKWN